MVVQKNSNDVRDNRTLFDVLKHEANNIFHFVLPMIVVHNLVWVMKPIFTESEKGPWEILWHKFLDTFGDDPYLVFVYGTFTVTTVMFWIMGVAFTVLDVYQKPAFLMKYKVQPGKNTPVDKKKLTKAIWIAIVNQLMGIPAAMIGFQEPKDGIRYLPGITVTIIQLILTMIIYDTIFYHSHRLLHHKSIYKYVHKLHHEWQAPIAISSIYAHPIENIITSYIAVSAGVFIFRMSIPVAWFWYCWFQMNSQFDHSGFHFPFIASPEFHDYHHLKFHTCYGWLTFWDWVYRTDKEFIQSKAHARRHVRLHTLKSARQLYPDKS